MTPPLPTPRRSPARTALALVLLTAAPAALLAASPEPAEEARRKRGEVKILERTVAEAPVHAQVVVAELARAGGGLSSELFARGWPTGPAVQAVTKDGAEKVARALASRAALGGQGLALSTSRHMSLEHARAKAAGERVPGTTRDFAEQVRIPALARAAGLPAAPKDAAKAVYLEAGKDGLIRADALGWGLTASVRLARELGFHRRTEGGGPVVGDAGDAGFDALLHLSIAGAKVAALRAQLALGQGGLGEATLTDYDPFSAPRYFPHAWKLVKSPEEDGGPLFEVTDPKSRLFDQAALLLGCCELARLASGPGIADGLGLMGPAKGMGDVREELFPLAQCAQAKDVARFLFRNLTALHFDPTAKCFASEAVPGERGNRIETIDAALALVALEAAHDLFADDQKLKAEVRKLLAAQAAFVESRLQPDGTLPAATVTGPGAAAVKEPASLAAEALVIEALLAGSRALQDEKLLAAARKHMRRLEARRFDPWASLYLGADPAAEALVTPMDAAFTLGALRELALTAKAPEAIDRFRDVFGALSQAGAFQDGAAATLKLKVVRP